MNTPVRALCFPQCTVMETHILQLRARGLSYRAISDEVGLAPRKVSDTYFRAMRKVINYFETSLFLEGKT